MEQRGWQAPLEAFSPWLAKFDARGWLGAEASIQFLSNFSCDSMAGAAGSLGSIQAGSLEPWATAIERGPWQGHGASRSASSCSDHALRAAGVGALNQGV